MNRIERITTISAALLLSSAALAGERTVTLAVEKMSCTTCPYIVKQALSRVSGVKHANVSFDDKRATVTFDDAVTTVDGLTRATSDAGFPSRLVEE